MHEHPDPMRPSFRQLLHYFGVIDGSEKIAPGIVVDMFDLLFVFTTVRKYYRSSSSLAQISLRKIFWLTGLRIP